MTSLLPAMTTATESDLGKIVDRAIRYLAAAGVLVAAGTLCFGSPGHPGSGRREIRGRGSTSLDPGRILRLLLSECRAGIRQCCAEPSPQDDRREPAGTGRQRDDQHRRDPHLRHQRCSHGLFVLRARDSMRCVPRVSTGRRAQAPTGTILVRPVAVGIMCVLLFRVILSRQSRGLVVAGVLAGGEVVLYVGVLYPARRNPRRTAPADREAEGAGIRRSEVHQ